MPRTASGPWTSTATSPRDVLPNCSVPTRSPPTLPAHHGWRRVAEAEYDLLAEETRRYLDAYAEGVNAYLEGKSATEVSLEYAVLAATNSEYEIEPWSAVDSLAWLKAMAWDLAGNMHDEIARASLLARGLPREQVEELYPAYPEEQHAPILAGGRVRDGKFVLDSDEAEQRDEDAADIPATAAVRALAGLQEPLEAIPRTFGPASSDLGSNSWVVSGEHTASGCRCSPTTPTWAR